jgi:molecular chaperone GrpE
VPSESEERKSELKPVEPGEQNPETPEMGLEKELAETKQKAESYLDSWKRAQADFINYKRHAEQEKLEMGKYASGQLILSLLPVLDDFERAFASLHPEAKPKWVTGVKLIESKMRTVLENQGLSPIEAVGKPFDPVLHEAVMHGKGPEGIVVGEVRRGYKLYDKVLRPSQVIVGNGETDEPQEKSDIVHGKGK